MSKFKEPYIGIPQYYTISVNLQTIRNPYTYM